MYFNKFVNVFRPLITPSSKTFKSFSSSIISAVSFAISTAVSTDIPTSACFKGGLSLIPSPIYPTVFPFSWKILTTLCFCIGESFENKWQVFTLSFNSSSVSFSTSFPERLFFVSIPTFLHTLIATPSLSPVNTTVSTPYFFKAFIAFFALAFGGSKNPTNPINTILLSSWMPNVFTSWISFFCAIASTLNPSLLFSS